MTSPVYFECHLTPNTDAHHTKDFDILKEGILVLRRGQPFTLDIKFRQRPFDLSKDRLILYFDFGKTPNVPKGTKAILRVGGPSRTLERPHLWHVKNIQSQQPDCMQLQIHIPANVPVGLWKCYGESYYSDGNPQPKFEKASFGCEQWMYILFNPWCQDDSVFMGDEAWREECILNTSGTMWAGTCRALKGRSWVYGQFDKVVLPVCDRIFEVGGVDDSQRGNPVEVTRVISQMVNSSDDDGIVQPSWDGKYTVGTAPAKWTGSIQILEDYKNSNFTPVKYGQCWVFAGVTTTICRALGIPCRPVTNFISAHDTNKTLTVDKYFDVFGEKIEGGPSGDVQDSVWNYHVWNECYMKRHDLPRGNDGWQVIDATPQRESQGMFRCGPASVSAVYRGDVGLNHDTGFVFSEVNADILHWKEDDTSDWGFSLVKCLKYKIGAKILTKLPNCLSSGSGACCEDLISQYKPPEGTELERMSVLTAMRGSKIFQEYLDSMARLAGAQDVVIDLQDIDRVPIGENFTVMVSMKNTSGDLRTVNGTISVCATDYTDTKSVLVKKERVLVELKSGQETEYKLAVLASDYLSKLIDESIKVYAVMTVKETSQMWCEEDDLLIEKPTIRFETGALPKVNEECILTMKIINPLDITLTSCSLSIEALGLLPRKCVNIGNIEGKGTEYVVENMRPTHSGPKHIVATFSSAELTNIDGTFSINVSD